MYCLRRPNAGKARATAAVRMTLEYETVSVWTEQRIAIVNLRRPLIGLVYGLAVWVVAFGVLMGGYAISQATNDQVGAGLYWRGAMICLMLLVGNIVLLVGALGVHALNGTDHDADDRPDHRDRDGVS